MTRPAAPRHRTGVVSVVLVNYRGADDTIACLRAFDDVDWPAERLELIVVENDSRDGSAERIRSAVPHAQVVESGSNTGFAGGCNLGVAHATGEYIGFINNDARPDRGWVAAAVRAFEADHAVAAVASKVLDWEGKLVDYIGAALTWYGMGYKPETDRPDDGSWSEPKDVLFATGSAMFVRADVFREVGGFDERFFMFYEDVDLGWRLNLLGHTVRYVPDSHAIHKHHASIAKFGAFRETYLLERNALMAMVKNYDDETLARVLPAAMALSVRRSLARGKVDATSLDLQRSPGGDDVGTLELPKVALTGAYAIDHLLDVLPSLLATRRDLQARRRRSDRELFALFGQAIEPALGISSYVRAHDELVDGLGLADLFRARQRVLVVTGEPLLETMAGPAIRAWEIAKALAPHHDVVLLSTTGARVTHPGFRVVASGGTRLRPHTDWADVIVFQGLLLDEAPWLVDSDTILVADVYDPMHLEQLEQARDLGPGGRALAVRETTRILNDQLRRADLALCASEKQRDFWLGQLAAQGRLNATVYDEDPTLRSLIEVVPFGIDDQPPVQRQHGIKGTVPGIGPDDKVILWGGGIYNWFDPLTLVRAVDRLKDDHPEVRLFFLGTKHPNPGVPDMAIAWETQQLAEQLGLSGRHVFFNDGWVPYAERADYLLDADVGVSTHYLHVETAYSFRTRILDYLWASLPIVATSGDTFGDLIPAHGLGRTVPAEDVDALVAALEEMLYDDAARSVAIENVRGFAQDYRWSRVLLPLVEFCRSPRRAADLAVARPADDPGTRRGSRRPRGGLGKDLQLVRAYLKVGGPVEVWNRALGRVKRVVGDRG